MATSPPPVWLITGASAGLGLALAQHALAQRHRVVCTARAPSAAIDALRAAGASIVPLDLAAGAAAIARAGADAERVYGRVDVLVNNAGYSVLGAVEEIPDDASRAQFETNFFGPLALLRAVLPGMRARAAGCVVNVSSIGGIDGVPTSGVYAASKFALEGMSESLAREVAPFNISVLTVQPGAFRTNFLAAFEGFPPSAGSAYAAPTHPVAVGMARFAALSGAQPGDPAKAAGAMFAAAVGRLESGPTGELVRLPLGRDAAVRFEGKIERLRGDLEGARAVAVGMDLEG